MALILAVLLGAHFALPAHADGEGPPSFRERPQAGQPVRFTDAAGHVFQPERLVVLEPGVVRAAALPASTHRARSEEHVDLSGLPLLGHVFGDRLAPGDARRRGVRVGPLTRIGDTLVLDARESSVPIEARQILLTANFPRQGAVSYRIGPLAFNPATPPARTGRRAGAGWLVGDVLVLAGPGREPAIEDLEGIIEGLVR